MIDSCEEIWLSDKPLDCRLRDCEFDPPLTPTKITKRRYVLILSRKNAPMYQCLTLGMLKNLVCHVWWALQYLALWAIETKNLYALMPNGQR